MQDFRLEQSEYSTHVLMLFLQRLLLARFEFDSLPFTHLFSLMDIRGKKFLVIGGSGLIGSHTVDALLQEDIGEVVVYDNFVRGRMENLQQSRNDSRFKVYDIGGDILQTDILEAAMQDVDGVFHFGVVCAMS